MTPLENARKRLIDLKKQVEKIESFIEMYERFSVEGADADIAIHGSTGPTELTGNKPVDTGDNKTVDKSRALPRRRRSGIPTVHLVAMVERILGEIAQPMTRGELLEALEYRDVVIPAEDKPRYIGTIMWRHKAKFVNIEGRGYWLRGEPVPSPGPVIEPESEADLSNLFGN